MKKIVFAVVIISMIVSASSAQMRKVENQAFDRGEKLTYSVYYDAILTGKVKAGSAIFEVKDENKLISGRNTYHIAATGKTKGAFNWFFKVIDRYESYIDEEALIPWLFIRRVDEGGYIINQDVTFNQAKKIAHFKDNKDGRTSSVATPEYVQDMISAIYYARTCNFDLNASDNDLSIKFLLDDTVYSTKVLYLGRETLQTSIGEVRCIKIKPQVLTGSVFKDPYPVVVYVSDDKNHIPIMAESEVLVGTVKLILVEYAGLRNAFTSLRG